MDGLFAGGNGRYVSLIPRTGCQWGYWYGNYSYKCSDYTTTYVTNDNFSTWQTITRDNDNGTNGKHLSPIVFKSPYKEGIYPEYKFIIHDGARYLAFDDTRHSYDNDSA